MKEPRARRTILMPSRIPFVYEALMSEGAFGILTPLYAIVPSNHEGLVADLYGL